MIAFLIGSFLIVAAFALGLVTYDCPDDCPECWAERQREDESCSVN